MAIRRAPAEAGGRRGDHANARHDPELAIGFLVSEGLLAPADLVGVSVEMGDPADVATPENELVVRIGRPFDAATVPARAFVASASCGICGKSSLDDVAIRCAPLPAGPLVDAAVVAGLPDGLRAGQALFEQTGGLTRPGSSTQPRRSWRCARTSGTTTRWTSDRRGRPRRGAPLHDRV
jgi:formate dehydrogenase assembly factor FdhD